MTSEQAVQELLVEFAGDAPPDDIAWSGIEHRHLHLRRSRRVTWSSVPAVAAALALVVAVVALRDHRDDTRLGTVDPPPVPPAPHVVFPAATHSTLVVTDAKNTVFVDVDRWRVRRSETSIHLDSPGRTPIVTGKSIVFGGRATVFRIDRSLSGPAVPLGPGTFFVPSATSENVWVFDGAAGNAATEPSEEFGRRTAPASLVAPDGHIVRSVPSLPFAANIGASPTIPTAATDDEIFYRYGATGRDFRWLRVDTLAVRPGIDGVSASCTILWASNPFLLWNSAARADDPTDCSQIHVLDMRDGSERVYPMPESSFPDPVSTSPDESHLALEAPGRDRTQPGANGQATHVLDLHDGTVRTIPSPMANASSTAWSADGRFVFRELDYPVRRLELIDPVTGNVTTVEHPLQGSPSSILTAIPDDRDPGSSAERVADCTSLADDLGSVPTTWCQLPIPTTPGSERTPITGAGRSPTNRETESTNPLSPPLANDPATTPAPSPSTSGTGAPRGTRRGNTASAAGRDASERPMTDRSGQSE